MSKSKKYGKARRRRPTMKKMNKSGSGARRKGNAVKSVGRLLSQSGVQRLAQGFAHSRLG